MYPDHVTAVFDCLESAKQRLSTCALSKEAIAKKGSGKESAGAQLRKNTSRAGHLEETQIDGRSGSGGSPAWSRRLAPTAIHDMWSHHEAPAAAPPPCREESHRSHCTTSPSHVGGSSIGVIGVVGSAEYSRQAQPVSAERPADRRRVADMPPKMREDHVRDLDPTHIFDNQPVGVLQAQESPHPRV